MAVITCWLYSYSVADTEVHCWLYSVVGTEVHCMVEMVEVISLDGGVGRGSKELLIKQLLGSTVGLAVVGELLLNKFVEDIGQELVRS